jgi:large subunit ribosomal protein L23
MAVKRLDAKDPWTILKHPHLTEKSIGMVEKANMIVFVVDRKAKKPMIKDAFEKAFEVKVDRVNTEITSDAEKKAYIKLKKEYKAIDVATKLGVI